MLLNLFVEVTAWILPMSSSSNGILSSHKNKVDDEVWVQDPSSACVITNNKK